MPDDASGRVICRDARRWTRELFSGLANEIGAANSKALAHQLQLLYDGAAASAYMDSDPGAILHAKAAAAILIDTARQSSRMPRARR
jgi:hypothetical protein